MPACVPHVKTARLYRITITESRLLSLFRTTMDLDICTCCRSQSPKVWTYTLQVYVRTLTCRMSARVHQKPQVKEARPHAVTIAEDPLLSQLSATL